MRDTAAELEALVAIRTNERCRQLAQLQVKPGHKQAKNFASWRRIFKRATHLALRKPLAYFLKLRI